MSGGGLPGTLRMRLRAATHEGTALAITRPCIAPGTALAFAHLRPAAQNNARDVLTYSLYSSDVYCSAWRFSSRFVAESIVLTMPSVPTIEITH